MRSIVIRLMRFAPRAYWMVIFQYRTRRTFGMNVVEPASWSAVDIIPDAVLPSSTSSFFFDQADNSFLQPPVPTSILVHLKMNTAVIGIPRHFVFGIDLVAKSLLVQWLWTA